MKKSSNILAICLITSGLTAFYVKPIMAIFQAEEVKLDTDWSEENQPELVLENEADLKVDSSLVAANTRFGFKLFEEIVKKNPNKNVFISPTSIAIALTMVYNGASGETQQAMAQTLELKGISLAEINKSNAALKASLENTDPQIQLAIANSLWIRKGIGFRQEFLQNNRDFYGAQVTSIDFNQSNTAAKINDWIDKSTNGKINQIIDRIEPNSVMYLLNAIYFKGTWTQQFEKTATTTRPFTLLNGTQKQQPMMSQSGEYKYYENEQFQSVNLPYGNGRVSMYVFLPKKQTNLAAFYQTLKADNWKKWMQKFQSQSGSILLPRFKLEYDIELQTILSKLGMGSAFGVGSRANFTSMTSKDQKVKIDEVKHKTFVEVNEEGTEAAAVTSVEAIAESESQPESFKMIIDRPFFIAIRDNQTETILFMGAIIEPN